MLNNTSSAKDLEGFQKKRHRASVTPFDPPGEQTAREARTNASGCNECKVCVDLCPFLAKYGTPAAIATMVLAGTGRVDPYECSLCNLCGAVCPEQLSPTDMFLAMRRQAVESGSADLSRYAPLIKYEQRGHSALFAWYPPEGTRTVFFPGCTLPGTQPRITWRFYEQLKHIFPGLGMVLDCCHKPSHDLGRQKYFLKRFHSIRDRLVAQGVAEVLVTCPNCYKVFAKYGAPLKTTTVYEALAHNAQSVPAKAVGQVVVHDPCPLRYEEAVQASVRTLLTSQGLTVRKTKHTGKRTLCCGEGGAVGLHTPDYARAWAVKRKILAGNDRIVTYCAGCVGSLGRVAQVSHLGEILFERDLALAGKCRISKTPMTYVNRLLLKLRLRKSLRAGLR